jgi:DNA-binding NarL/FixJ family response regulator
MYRLMRVRVRTKMFDELEAHALRRSAECNRRIYVSDIVRYAIRAYLMDHARQDHFVSSVRNTRRGASVVPAQNVQITFSIDPESGLDA